MIRYLRHEEIKKDKWDGCIGHSVNGLVYAQSWYLDLVCPGWEALIEDDYSRVFPLTHDRKFGIRYLYQPFFTQQLGVFSTDHLTESVVGNFLDVIPLKFRFAEIHLNSLNKVNPAVFETIQRINLELDLIKSFENLRNCYDQNTRRNLRKALDAGITIGRKVEVDDLITLFRENYGKREGILQFRHYEILRELILYCLKNTFSFTIGAYLPDGSISAAVFFLRWQSRLIFHFAASDRKARETGAMFLLVDSMIREFASQPLILDFEGSNNPYVARFYKGFGAVESSYPMVRINRLPWLIKKIVDLKKGH